MFELREYQRKAVNELLQSFSAMLAREETKKICVFQAPTGSGKTLMTAIFISELIKENPSEDLCFLWVSIGKGEVRKHWIKFFVAFQKSIFQTMNFTVAEKPSIEMKLLSLTGRNSAPKSDPLTSGKIF